MIAEPNSNKLPIIAMAHYSNSNGFVGGVRTKAWVDQALKDGWDAHLISPKNSKLTGGRPLKYKKSILPEGAKKVMVSVYQYLRPYSALFEPSNISLFFYLKVGSRLIRTFSNAASANYPVVLLTSYGPAVTLFAGFFLKSIYKSKLLWIIDYRDDWSTNYKKRFLLPHLERSLERLTVGGADRFISVSDEYARTISENIGRDVEVVRNGFDREIFDLLRANRTALTLRDSSGNYNIRYVGTLNSWRGGLEAFCRAISRANKAKERITFEVAGKANEYSKTILKSHGAKYHGLLDHGAALELMARSDALLFLDTGVPGEVSSKVYEYMASHLPVIVFAAGDVVICAKMLEQAGVLAGVFRDELQAMEVIEGLSSFEVRPNIDYINRFTREVQAREFTKIVSDAFKS